jgi:hypothetical protein
MRLLLGNTLLVVGALFVLASKPILVENKKLFNIERSKDKNEIVYEGNYNIDGQLNIQEPIKTYWIKHENNHRIEPLTWIQKNYAYGIEYIKTESTFAEFQFVSYKKRQFQIKKDSDGNFKVFTTSNNKKVIVNRIFIQIDGGTFWFPKISRVELHAQDAKTKEKNIEIIIP